MELAEKFYVFDDYIDYNFCERFIKLMRVGTTDFNWISI